MLLATAGADAQIIRPRYELGQPTGSLSLGAAIQQGWTVNDGSTHSRWQFGDATQWVASLEKVLSGGASIGLLGTYSNVALQYTPLASSGVTTQTDANANVSQLFATLHVANGTGFHSVLELSAGATMYSQFKAQADGTALPPSAADLDFSFAFGYGFGYAFSPRFSVDVVQDVTTALHQKTGLSAGDNSSVRMHGTRLVGRFGIGGH